MLFGFMDTIEEHRQLNELPEDKGYILTTDSSQLESITSYIPRGLLDEVGNDITGAILLIDDCDCGYREIWLTTSARPYGIYATYGRVL